MSDHAKSWCQRHSPFRGLQYFVHYLMCDLANDDHDNRLWIGDSALADRARVSVKTVQRTREDLIDLGMLEAIDRTTAPGRKAEYRLLIPALNGGHGVQRSDETVDMESITVDTESSERWTLSPEGCLSTKVVTPSNPRAASSTRQSRAITAIQRRVPCPDPFDVTPEMEEWVRHRVPRLNWRAETEKFSDHWRANGGVKIDWVAAWRNWMRRAAEYGAAKTTGSQGGRDLLRQRLERDAERDRRDPTLDLGGGGVAGLPPGR